MDDKPADSGSPDQLAARSAHGLADPASTPHPVHAPAVQPVTAAGDSSAFTRDAAAGHAPLDTPSMSTASAGAASGSREAFSALDGDAAAHSANWLHAGAHSAEAGFEDPALGWVSVRAEMTAGGIHAAVVPGTAEAAQALGAHMAGLNSYLSEQRTPVHTLTLASPGSDAGSNVGSGQGGGQGSASGQQTEPQRTAPSLAAGSQAWGQTARAPVEAPSMAARAGTSISLIA